MNETGQKKHSLKSQSAWLLFAKVAGFGFAFLLPLLVVRFLTQEKVGVYRQVFLVIVNAVVDSAARFFDERVLFSHPRNERRGAAIFNILLFNFVVGGAGVSGAFSLSASCSGISFQNAEMTRLAPKIGVVIWLWIFSPFWKPSPSPIRNRGSPPFLSFSRS